MIRALIADTSGATAILTALTLAATMGFVALGIESATGLHERRQMQDAADAAALAGALAIRAGSSRDPSSIAHAVVSENAFTESLGYSVSVNTQLAKSRVEVGISRPRASRFGGLIGDEGGVIRVHSAAHLEAITQGCILGLAPKGAIRISLASDLSLDGCERLSADDGLSRIRLSEADPYRDLAMPTAPPCSTKGTLVRSNMAARSAGGTFTFCQGLTIASRATLKLEPGIYVISGGPLLVQKDARLAGQGVTLLLAPGSSVQFAEGAFIELSAPRSGPWAGVAIAGNGTTGASSMVAGRTQYIVGAIHLPDQSLAFAGSANSPCTQIIADTVKIVGTTRLQNRCADSGTRPMVDRVARLAE